MDEYEEITRRSYGVYSKEEQKKLRRSRVTIVGVGCDGGMDAYILARLGVGHLKLVDFDVNELSNLNRQPAAFYDLIGVKKVEAAKREFSRFNPHIEITAIDRKLTEENAEEILEGADVCIQGMDSIVGRIIFHRAAKKLGIPAVTMTGQPPFRSFISTILPSGPTYEELFGLDFVSGKKFAENPNLQEDVEKLKFSRAEHVSRRSSIKSWLSEFRTGKVGWGITPERAYLTSVWQANEAVRLLLGKMPQSIAPKAIISDIDGLEEFGLGNNVKSAILSPPNGKNWDYRLF